MKFLKKWLNKAAMEKLGFTLQEVAVTISVMGVVGLLVASFFVNTNETTKSFHSGSTSLANLQIFSDTVKKEVRNAAAINVTDGGTRLDVATSIGTCISWVLHENQIFKNEASERSDFNDSWPIALAPVANNSSSAVFTPVGKSGVKISFISGDGSGELLLVEETFQRAQPYYNGTDCSPHVMPGTGSPGGPIIVDPETPETPIYTVTFDVNGGDIPVMSRLVEHGSEVGILPDVTRLGYAFVGWSSDLAGLNPVTMTHVITNDITLYAQWDVNTYTITFNTSGATSATPAAQILSHGSLITVPAAPIRAGYVFVGWYSQPSGGDELTVGDVATSSQTFYAQWDTSTYTISFDVNGGTSANPADRVRGHGAVIGVPGTPVRAGHTFTGWFTTSASSGGTQLTALTTATANQTYYARWTGNVYTISFDVNGGTSANPADRVRGHGAVIGVPSDPTRTGYTFTGWFTASSGGTQLTGATTATVNQTYYAQWAQSSYTISFNVNGGTSANPADRIRTHGAVIGVPSPNPTRTGYTFTGWFTTSASSGGTQLTALTTATANQTYYARWTLNSYTITFNANGGTPVPDRIVNHGSLIGVPADPTRIGYVFTGWFTATSGGTQLTGATTATQNRTYYSQWANSIHTVTFNSNGGSAVNVRYINHGASIGGETPLVNPTRDNYTFAGWWTTEATGGTQITNGYIVNESFTAHARWNAAQYTVTFSTGGGTPVPAARTVSHGSTIGTLPPAPTRTGHNFLGWSHAANTVVTGNMTVTAWWEPILYVVDVDPQSESTSSTTYTRYYGEPLNLGVHVSTPTRDGYNFVGWYDAPTGGNLINIGTYIVTGLTQLYGHWTPTTFWQAFDGYGSIMQTYDTPYNLPAYSAPTGYTFMGWYTGQFGTGTRITSATIVKQYTYGTGAAEPYARLYPYIQPIPYTVTFDANGGSGGGTKTVNYGSTVGTLLTASRTGYTFAGWWTATSGGTQVTDATVITGPMTIYARWSPNTYIVTFNGNGGSSPAGVLVPHGSSISSMPTSTRTGYTFNGWWTATSGGTQVTGSTAITGPMTIYARWTIITYTVTLNPNGGSGGGTKTVNHGSAVGTLPTAGSRTGYTFAGWWTATSGGTQVTDATVITSNVTYYARWMAITYTVTFNPNGGSGGGTKTVDHGSAVGTLLTASRTGYTFNGWWTATSGGTQVTTATAVTGPMTIYARWTIRSYTVTFSANGGSPNSTKTVNHGSAVGTLPTPSRTGYTFNGWYTATSGGTQVTTSRTITANVTFYARWSIRYYTVTFNGNGGSTPAARSISYNSNLGALPGSVRNGYTLQGWWTTSAASGGTQALSTTKITSNRTYYARWTKNPTGCGGCV